MTEREFLERFINFVYYTENKSNWFLAIDNFLEAVHGEARRGLDDGYQAVALEVGKSYEALQRENARLKEENIALKMENRDLRCLNYDVRQEDSLGATVTDADLIWENARYLAALEQAAYALEDVQERAKRIREDKAVVGIEASYIERIARAASRKARQLALAPEPVDSK